MKFYPELLIDGKTGMCFARDKRRGSPLYQFSAQTTPHAPRQTSGLHLCLSSGGTFAYPAPSTTHLGQLGVSDRHDSTVLQMAIKITTHLAKAYPRADLESRLHHSVASSSPPAFVRGLFVHGATHSSTDYLYYSSYRLWLNQGKNCPFDSVACSRKYPGLKTAPRWILLRSPANRVTRPLPQISAMSFRLASVSPSI